MLGHISSSQLSGDVSLSRYLRLSLTFFSAMFEGLEGSCISCTVLTVCACSVQKTLPPAVVDVQSHFILGRQKKHVPRGHPLKMRFNCEADQCKPRTLTAQLYAKHGQAKEERCCWCELTNCRECTPSLTF